MTENYGYLQFIIPLWVISLRNWIHIELMNRYYTYYLNSYRRSPIICFLKMNYHLVYSTTSLADFLVISFLVEYFDQKRLDRSSIIGSRGGHWIGGHMTYLFPLIGRKVTKLVVFPVSDSTYKSCTSLRRMGSETIGWNWNRIEWHLKITTKSGECTVHITYLLSLMHIPTILLRCVETTPALWEAAIFTISYIQGH